jgi:beta-phosphoglucomutase family hydrolase
MKMLDRAVLWDLDGVIADTAFCHCLSWQQAFVKRGVTFTEEQFRHHFGQRNDLIIRCILGPDVPLDQIQNIAQDKEEFFQQNIVKDLRPFPGVVNLLRLLKEKGIKSSIGSSAPRENIRITLSHLDIENYFQAIASGQDVSEGKPSPQIFLLAAKRLNVDPAHCIVIEDSVAGIEAAKSGGMLCIAVTNTHPALNLSRANLIVDSLEKVDFNALVNLFKKNI